jgi:hypothetical protein
VLALEAPHWSLQCRLRYYREFGKNPNWRSTNPIDDLNTMKTEYTCGIVTRLSTVCNKQELHKLKWDAQGRFLGVTKVLASPMHSHPSSYSSFAPYSNSVCAISKCPYAFAIWSTL